MYRKLLSKCGKCTKLPKTPEYANSRSCRSTVHKCLVDYSGKMVSITANAVTAILLCLTWSWPGAVATYVALENNVYTNVIVGVSPNIEFQSKSSIMSQIQTLFDRTSQVLYNATGNRARFANVTVLFPPAWMETKKKRVAKRDVASPSFETADFRLDIENNAYGSKYPYAQQSGGCGEPGEFIHITPGFIADTENLDYNSKLLAIAWVRYRYGVFDEMGYKGDQVHPQMYYHSNGNAKYSICSNDDVAWEESSPCKSQSKIEGLDESCNLKADAQNSSNQNVRTSMMAPPMLPVADKFCDSTNHNKEAPNRQNVLCNGQSVMDVILGHPDFANGMNPPGPEDSLPPISVQASKTTQSNLDVVIVWDPMPAAIAKFNAIPSLEKFVRMDFPSESYLGIIQTPYPKDPHVSNYQMPVSGREWMEKKINEMTISSTPTQAGNLQQAASTAVNTMFQSDINAYARALVVFSNYAKSDELRAICQLANNSQSQLHLVTYTPDVAQAFLQQAECSGRTSGESQTYLIQGQQPNIPSTDEFNACYEKLQERAMLDNVLMNLPNAILPDVFYRPIVFHQRVGFLNSTTSGSFELDVSPSSMNTYFYAQSCQLLGSCLSNDLIAVTLDGSELTTLDEYTQAYNSSSPLSRVGRWDYSITPKECPLGKGIAIPYLVTAAGQPIRPMTINDPSVSANSFEVESWIVESTNELQMPVVRLFASVKKGTTPIFDAKVMANITSSKKDTPIVTVTLYDDGKGNPDITAQDGVYSAHFTQFVKDAGLFSYTVSLNISTVNGIATMPTKQYTWISGDSDMGLTPAESFTRTVQGPTFAVASTGSDVYPPGPIRDFHVKSVTGQEVTLAWTAPGNDYDFGQASRYIIACKRNRDDLLNINQLDTLTSDVDVSYVRPELVKTSQQVTIYGSYDSNTYFCAMQAIDDSTPNNYGPVSNIVSYYIRSSSPTPPKPASAPTVQAHVVMTIGVVLLCVIF